LNETELRSGNSFFTRALIPSFSTRNLSSSSHASSTTSAPSQILSVASYQSDAGPSYAFGVTRDRKLKFWNLDSGICIKATDLPKPSYNPDSGLELEMARSRELESPGGATPVRGKAPILLSPTPQPFLKIVQGDEDSSFPSYLVLYVPAAGGNPPAFHIYGIATNTSGVVSELVAVTERICPMNAATLVDFEASPFGPDDSASQGWTLWTLWQEGGESEIRFVDLQELSAEGESSDVVEWTTVDRGTTSVAVWNAGHFDELLRDSSKSVAQVFIHHLGYPGRYPPATLAYALAHYEDTLLYETDPHHRPAVLSLEHNSAFECICAIVGCTVQLETSPQTGALLHDAHNQRLKVEWLRFIALCNESRAAALFPVVLAVCSERRVAVVVMRDAVAVPIVQDTILTLRQLAAPETRDDDKAQSFLNLPSELLQLSYPHFAPRGIRHDVFAIFTAIATLTQGMSPESSRGLEAELCGRARTMFTHNMEETSIEIYERVLEPFIDDTLRESLAEQMRDLVTPEAAFVALWTALTTSELVQPLPSSAAMSATSDLTSALLTDSLAAAIEARYTTALGLVVLLIYIYGEEQDLVPHIASLTSSSFATLHTLSSLRWIMQQSSSPSSTHSPPNDEGILERFGDMRVSNFDDPNAVVPFSLLNRLLRHEYSPLLAVDATLPQAVTSAMCSFLQLTGLITHKRIFVDTPAAVLFARRVQQMGLPALALEFVGMQGKGPGMSYVAGLAQLDLGSTVEAEASFLNEMSGACKSNRAPPRGPVLTIYALQTVASLTSDWTTRVDSLQSSRSTSLAVSHGTTATSSHSLSTAMSTSPSFTAPPSPSMPLTRKRSRMRLPRRTSGSSCS
jgi:nuclear pore complex protein Nup160